MTNRKMIAGLSHKYCVDMDVFFAEIDKLGGWPLGFQFVGFEHSSERAAGFTNHPGNDGWWTILAGADDYYLWKLSPETLQRIADAVRDAIRLPKVNAINLNIRDTRGHIATLRKPAVATVAG